MARGFIQGDVEQGGNIVVTDGRNSTTKVQKSYPLATVTVYNAGTVVLSTIYSTEAGTPLANPFTADINGHWGFWADQARYDVKFSGAGISTPYTLFSLETVIASGLVDPGSNGFLARTAPNTLAARTILGTTSAITVSNGTGSGDPVINLDTSLNFSGKTISGGTYLSPIIANFQNAIHNHENNIGGGQLNATNIFSAGTVPIARLPIMVGDSGAGGVAGLVPAPGVGDASKFLRGDGTWQVTGGGGGTPGSPNFSVQYNNGGAFNGITGSSSDGTQVTFTSGVLRATSPRITTSIFDTNGLAIISLSALGSAVNNFQIANAASGGHPVLSAIGSGTDINIVLTPKGAGIISTAGNLQISNNAPQISLIDVNDSKTVRMSLNGANWDFTNDTAGTVPIRIDTSNSSITIVGDLFFSKASTITIGRPSQTDLQLNNSSGVFTFGQIPVLPGSDPTTSNQATRKAYVDSRRTYFTIPFFILDPSVNPAVNDSTQLPVWSPPLGITGCVLTRIGITRFAGTHTGGTAISFSLIVNASSVATVQFDDTNNAATAKYRSSAIAQSISSSDLMWVVVSGRSGTIAERSVTIWVEGYQNVAS